MTPGADWVRRARPLLGTIVEVGARAGRVSTEAAVAAAFDTLADAQARLSRFEPASVVARFNAARAGSTFAVDRPTAEVLAAAQSLRDATAGVFDISLCSAPHGWLLDDGRLHKLCARTQLDLGGIAKGYAVDCAVEAMMARGCQGGWVNAGGDIRAFGDAAVPLVLRDERSGGVRPFALLSCGSFATSHFDVSSRSEAAAPNAVRAHASVAAPLCLWADALTKVVAVTSDASHPMLRHHGARAWLH